MQKWDFKKVAQYFDCLNQINSITIIRIFNLFNNKISGFPAGIVSYISNCNRIVNDASKQTIYRQYEIQKNALI